MLWEVDAKAAKRLSDIARAVKALGQGHPRDRPRSRGRGDLLARARSAEGSGECSRTSRSSASSSTPSPSRRCARPWPSARHRPGAGRRLSGPPRARLSRRLQPVAGAVAQAAGGPFGRPGAIGRAAARLRPRTRDRGVHAAGILVARGASCDTPQRAPFTARLVGADGQQDQPARRRHGRGGGGLQGGARTGAVSRSRRSRRSPSSGIPFRRSAPRRCSRTRRASSGCRRRAPCRSRRSSTRA